MKRAIKSIDYERRICKNRSLAPRRGSLRPFAGALFRVALRAGQRRDGRPGQFRGALLGRDASGQLYRRGLLSRQDPRGVVEERLPGVFRQGPERRVLDRGRCRGRRRAARPGDRRGGEELLPRDGHAPLGADAPHEGRAEKRRRGGRRDGSFPLAGAPRTGRREIRRHAAQPGGPDHLLASCRRRRAQCRRQLRRKVLGGGLDRGRRHAEPYQKERFRGGLGAGRRAGRRRVALRNPPREGPGHRSGQP